MMHVKRRHENSLKNATAHDRLQQVFAIAMVSSALCHYARDDNGHGVATF